MGPPRSTYYDAPGIQVGDSEIVDRISGRSATSLRLAAIGEWVRRFATKASS